MALGAYRRYGGNLTKYPCHNSLMVYMTWAKPSYELAELAEHLDLQSPIKTDAAQDYGYGRNFCVVEHGRH